MTMMVYSGVFENRSVGCLVGAEDGRKQKKQKIRVLRRSIDMNSSRLLQMARRGVKAEKKDTASFFTLLDTNILGVRMRGIRCQIK